MFGLGLSYERIALTGCGKQPLLTSTISTGGGSSGLVVPLPEEADAGSHFQAAFGFKCDVGAEFVFQEESGSLGLIHGCRLPHLDVGPVAHVFTDRHLRFPRVVVGFPKFDPIDA